MSDGPELIFDALRSNAWDAADPTWLADLTRVLRRFNAYVSGELRHAQEDPRAGMLPDRVGDLGRALVMIGERLQEDARVRTAFNVDLGAPILKYLLTLAPGAYVSARHIIGEIGAFDGSVESALTDLVRSGAVDIKRPRAGATNENTTYALTPEGRELVQLPVTSRKPRWAEGEDGHA